MLIRVCYTEATGHPGHEALILENQFNPLWHIRREDLSASAPVAEVANAPAEVANAPAEVANAPAEVANAPAEVANAPAEVANAPAEVANEPLKAPARAAGRKSTKSSAS